MSFRINWVSFITIFRKEVVRFTRIWLQTLLPPAITMTLYFVIFGNLIGSRIGEMDGQPYMRYIVPGLIMMSIITSSFANVVSSFYSTKFHRSIEEIMVSPTSSLTLLLGFVCGGISRGLLVGIIVMLIALLFTDLSVHNWAITCYVATITAALFSTAGLINGVYANSFDDISIVPTFVLTPLTYLGGVFYSVSMLPEFGQIASLFNPIFYVVNSFRYGIIGISDTDVAGSIGLLTLLFLAVFSYAWWILAKGIGIRS